MEHKRRVESAIRHLPVDRTPCAELLIDDAVVKSLCGNVVVEFEHRLEFVQSMGLDAVCLHPNLDWSNRTCFPRSINVQFCDLHKWAKAERFTFAVLDGPFGWGSRMLGFNRFISQLMRGSSEITDLISAVEQLNLEMMRRLADEGIDGFIIADDIAYSNGIIVRPNVLRKNIFPSLSCQVEQARTLKLPIFFHSDGNLNLVLDDIVKVGFDGLHCIESLAGMDIGLLKKHYGKRLCLWGNLDPAVLYTPYGCAELQNKVNGIISAAGKDSGLIFGTSSGLCEGMRITSLRQVYENVRQTFW